MEAAGNLICPVLRRRCSERVSAAAFVLGDEPLALTPSRGDSRIRGCSQAGLTGG